MVVVQVDPEELRAHAGSLEKCVEVMSTAEGASSHIAMDGQAYGLLCSWLVPIMNSKQQEFHEALTFGKSVVQGNADAVRVIADEVTLTDADNAVGLDQSDGYIAASTAGL